MAGTAVAALCGLRDSRRARGISEPLFGLEHGLTQAEVEALEGAVRTSIALRPPSWDHWLLWIVYSAEMGYRYSGYEYWQTFEQETPRWVVNGDRYRIRKFYQQFQREFGGAMPSGPWAEHFSIICWPITHAILPKDLQIQLARTLYESRYFLSREVLSSPEQLGDLIATRSWNASSRFQDLAQETRLLGQIAAALLFRGQDESVDLIYPPTLERISEDLDRERQARDWLRRARRSVSERVTVRGLRSLAGRTNLASIRQLTEAKSAIDALGLEPDLVLRPRNASRTSWVTLIEIPDLQHLLLRFPQTREILTGCRCVVAGSSGRPLARGRLLHGAQRVKLTKWPRPDEVLLQFESDDSQLDFLLRTECLLRPGPTWLLRVASDGLAYECKGLRVRPGQSYVMLSTVGPINAGDHATPIEVECEGVHALMLNLPSSLGPEWQDTIQNLGLGQARTIEVWPAGLAAMTWDGDGHGEWPASERPCLGILADHPLESLHVTMERNQDRSIDLKSINAGEPLFLELPHLPVGVHRLKFSLQSRLADQSDILDDLEAVIRIREESSPTSIDSRGPLSVEIEPRQPSMEQLWGGEVDVLLRGPLNCEIVCRVSLLASNGDSPILVKDMPPINLPIDSEDWKAHFNEHIQNKRDVQEAYDVANACLLEFEAGELGMLTIRCERPFTPLRWILKRDGVSYVARLHDDTGHHEHPVTSHVTFESPCTEQRQRSDIDIHVPSQGGMYVARTSKYSAAIIVPPVLHHGDGFSILRLNPDLGHWVRSPDSAVRVVKMACLWKRAKLSGDLLSAWRRRQVMESLVCELIRILCGDSWARAERDFTSGRKDVKALETLSRAVSRNALEAAAVSVLLSYADRLARQDLSRRVGLLSSIAINYRLLPNSILRVTTDQAGGADVPYPRWLSELALRLATDPAGAERWAGAKLRTGLGHLMDSPSLPRAARLAVMATGLYVSPETVSGDLYAGWKWR